MRERREHDARTFVDTRQTSLDIEEKFSPLFSQPFCNPMSAFLLSSGLLSNNGDEIATTSEQIGNYAIKAFC